MITAKEARENADKTENVDKIFDVIMNDIKMMSTSGRRLDYTDPIHNDIVRNEIVKKLNHLGFKTKVVSHNEIRISW